MPCSDAVVPPDGEIEHILSCAGLAQEAAGVEVRQGRRQVCMGGQRPVALQGPLLADEAGAAVLAAADQVEIEIVGAVLDAKAPKHRGAERQVRAVGETHGHRWCEIDSVARANQTGESGIGGGGEQGIEISQVIVVEIPVTGGDVKTHAQSRLKAYLVPTVAGVRGEIPSANIRSGFSPVVRNPI